MSGPDRRLKAGPQNQAKTSRLLGLRDPRVGRNPRMHTTVYRTGPGIVSIGESAGLGTTARLDRLDATVNAILDALRRGQIVDKVPK